MNDFLHKLQVYIVLFFLNLVHYIKKILPSLE
jgi:hypothetical protein